MHRRAWLPTLGLLLLLSPAVLAQPRDPAAADRLFKEGRAAFDKGDYATACPKFAESQKADPAPGTILNLALCEERLGKVASARGHVVELLAQLDVKDERRPIAKDLFNKLDARVARLSITLAPGAPDTTLVRLTAPGESRPLAFGTEVFLDPGNYRLDISAPGRPDSHTDITLGEGQREARVVAPAAEGEKVSNGKIEGGGGAGGAAGSGGAGGAGGGDHPVTPPPSSAPLRRTIGFVAGGVGVASFIAAGVTGGLLISKKSTLDDLCTTQHNQCHGDWQSVQSSAKTILPINTATWIIGIAGVGAGAVLILTSLGGDKKDSPKEPPVTPAAAVLPGGGGVSVSGRF